MAIQTLHPPPPRRLYILDTDLSAAPSTRRGRILSCNPDGGDVRTVVDNLATLPDGIAIDRVNGHMYWTNMGDALSTDSGSIERANLADGTDRRTIVPAGTAGVFTPKQITLAGGGKMYWCDREGMKVMRADLDGSRVEVLVSTGDAAAEEHRRDQTRWCVGVAVDETRGRVYWTQKGPSKGGRGRILCASLEDTKKRPIGEDDVEVVLDGLPEPIDLELVDEDGGKTMLYWTDRGDPPRGNSLNRMRVDDEGTRRVEVLATRLHEAIGLAVDGNRGVVYVTDLAGGVYEVDVRTGRKRVIFGELGDITGIALL